MHGILDTSMGWVSNGVTGSQAFAAFDQGFDVWLGNSRANPPRVHECESSLVCVSARPCAADPMHRLLCHVTVEGRGECVAVPALYVLLVATSLYPQSNLAFTLL